MSCNLKQQHFSPNAADETWGGITFSITSSDDTKYADTLARVRMTWKDSTGVVAQTLDSDVSGEITIDSAVAYAWGFTVPDRILSLAAGYYSYAVEVTDSGGVMDKDYIAGTHQITADPHA